MMQSLFLSMLEISVGVSALILLVLVLMPFLGKVYKQKWRYWVWLLLAVRLLVPFHITLPEPAVSVTIPQGMIEERPLRVERPVTNRPVTSEQVVMQPSQTPSQDTVTPLPNVTQTPPVETVTPSVPDVTIPPTVETPADTTPETPVRTVTMLEVIAFAWVAVAVGFAVFHTYGYLRFALRSRRFNRPVEDPAVLQAFEDVKREMHIAKPLGFYRNALVSAPIMTGFLKPAVLMPERDIAPDDCRMVLRHELLHYKRHDLWYKLLLVAARCVHWFNPLVWLMLKRADNDLEVACDEDVVRARTATFRQQYCETILRVIRADRGKKPLLSTGFCAKKSVMKRRFVCALDQKPKRIGAFALALCCLSAVVCGALVSCELGAPASSGESSQITPGDAVVKPPEISPSGEVKVTPVDDEDFTFDENATLTPFLESENCLNFLAEEYPYVSDWKMLAHEEYVKVNYAAQEDYTDSWTLTRYAVLQTEQSINFEVLAIYYQVTYYRTNGVITSQSTGTVSRSGTKLNQIGCTAEDFKDVEFFFLNNSHYHSYSLYLPAKKLMLIPEGERTLTPVPNVERENLFVANTWSGSYYPFRLDFDTFNAYTEGSENEDPYLLLRHKQTGAWYSVGRIQESNNVALYNVLLGTEDERCPTVYPTSEGLKFFRKDDRENWFSEPYAVITAEEILPGGEIRFWLTSEFETDRNNGNRHALMYYDKSDPNATFHLISFNTEGEMLSNYDLGLKVFPEYLEKYSSTLRSTYGAIAYSQGVYYFRYLNENGGRDTYATDTRPGKDHTVQMTEKDTYRVSPLYTSQITVPDSAIDLAMQMFGARYAQYNDLIPMVMSFYYRTDGFLAHKMDGNDAVMWYARIFADFTKEGAQSFPEDGSGLTFSATEVEEAIRFYFYNANIDLLRQSEYYDAENETYHIDGFYGGIGERPAIITMHREQLEQDDGWIRMNIYLDELYDTYMVLTVDFMQLNDGSWTHRYVSYTPAADVVA